ncbi:MAG: DUF4412 domain-containing protein [Candidatus Tectomicrobia bacterium]|nr:DUF4412 domain-containing protein [Candidatus Tectomicrobia bacterium]
MRIAPVAALILWLLAGAAAPPARADTTLHQRVTSQFSPDRSPVSRKVILYVKGQRVRLEGDAWRRKPTLILFDPGVIVRLDHEKKTYMKIALKDLENVLKDADKIVRGVDELMGGKESRPEPRYRLEPTDVHERVNGYLCRVYALRRDNRDKDRGRVWITQESDAGKELYPIQRKIAAVAANLLPSIDPKLLNELERIGGTAVRILLMGKSGPFGPIQTDLVVEKIDRRPLEDSLFQVPAGYREDAVPREQSPGGRKPSALERRLKALEKLFQ